MKIVFAAAAMLFQFVLSGAVQACSLPQPKGEVVLAIDGMVQNCTDGLEARFDMASLEALPRKEVVTTNPWDSGPTRYEGVLLKDLLDHVGAQGKMLSIAALNDYRADLSVADAQSIPVILAYKRNGSYMPVREKGPLFVVFPFTDDPTLAVESRYAQSVWQVTRITVK